MLEHTRDVKQKKNFDRKIHLYYSCTEISFRENIPYIPSIAATSYLLLYSMWLAGSRVNASVYKATAVAKSPDWQAALEALTFSTKRAREAAPRDAEPVGSTYNKNTIV